MSCKSPCLACERKGCGAYHNECEKYLSYRQKVEKENKRKRECDFYTNGYQKEKKLKLDKIARNKMR